MPIDEAAANWWTLHEKCDVHSEIVETATKSTNTESEFIANSIVKTKINPRDIVLRKWRERQSKTKCVLVRKAVINSIKEKIHNTKHGIFAFNGPIIKEENGKAEAKKTITNADIEETSNLNVYEEQRWNLDSVFDGSRVEGFEGDGLGVGHANRLQMELGTEVAQCGPSARVVRAGAVGVRGLLDMPLPARDGLTTPRSARAPIGRRPPTSLPHQRKKEKSPETPTDMDSPGGSISSDLRRQNEELRARLAGESADHKRRLDTYRRAQQGQAALVSRLQAKVLQYKQRCSELENQMLETTPRSDTSYRPSTSGKAIALPSSTLATPSPDLRRDERITDLETALRKLEEEKRKCEKLVSQNNLLRDQLEESHQLNEALTNDLQKLTNDWEAMRDEMAIKEDEWKDEEQAFNDYYSNEHNRLLNLWREVVSVKRFFSDLQTNTERDLYKVKNDIDSAARDLVGTLSGYAITAYATHDNSKDLQPSQTSQGTAMESLRSDLHSVTNQRDNALSELKERDARIQRLLQELQGLEERCECAESVCSEASIMRSALEEIARALIQDSETDGPATHAHMTDRSPKRGVSQSANPTAFAESTISALQAALHKYQIQIHELQVKLQNTREQLMSCRKHSEAADTQLGSLENKVEDLQGKLDQTNADLNQVVQERESLQKTVEALRIDKNNLERNRVEINAMVESLTSDYEKLQKVNSRLEKAIEVLENEKRSLNCEVDHLHREVTSRDSVLRTEEERSSRLRSEIVSIKEKGRLV